MNKKYIIYNLKEASESLERIIHDFKNDLDYDKEEYSIDMQHIYHHLNTAWNSRFSTSDQSIKCSDEDFRTWRQFPNDIDMNPE